METSELIKELASHVGISEQAAKKGLMSIRQNHSDLIRQITFAALNAGISKDNFIRSLKFILDNDELVSGKKYKELSIKEEEGQVKESRIASLPNIENLTEAYYYVKDNLQDDLLFYRFDKTIQLDDKIVATWLGITSKTLENYRKRAVLNLKVTLKEHMVLLLSLYEHGQEVFGSVQDFETWLTQKNILLDNTEPSEFLDTITGVSFIDRRLTAIEFGENV